MPVPAPLHAFAGEEDTSPEQPSKHAGDAEELFDTAAAGLALGSTPPTEPDAARALHRTASPAGAPVFDGDEHTAPEQPAFGAASSAPGGSSHVHPVGTSGPGGDSSRAGLEDELEPSAEYIAAREAALRAAREARSTPGNGAGAAHAPPRSDTVSPEELDESYEQTMAALRQFEDDPYGAMPDAQAIPAGLAPSALNEASLRVPPPEPRAPTVGGGQRKRRRRTPPRKRKRVIDEATRTNQIMPRERNAMRMAVGLAIGGVGVLLLLVYLPMHAPVAPESLPRAQVAIGEEAPEYIWRFTESLYLRARIVASAFVALGLAFFVNGAMFRPSIEVPCARCGRYVMGQQDGISLRCPRGRHNAGHSVPTIVLGGLLVALVALMIFTVAMGSITRV